MAKDKTQLLRLVFIDQKIRQGMRDGNLANCRTMATEYEVSAKSILRDIDYLKNQRDAPIAYDAVRRGYYYTEGNYSLPALSLSESDLFAICIAEQAMQQYRSTPLYDNLKKIFSKIEESLPANISLDPAHLDKNFIFLETHRTIIEPEIWQKTSTATRNQQQLLILYQKPSDGKPQKRVIDPYRMVSYEGEWYIRGYCHQRNKHLTFALSRIKEASLLASHFNQQKDIEGENEFGIFRGSNKYKVKIHFNKSEAPYVKERLWNKKQKISENKKGEVTLSFPVSHLREVKRWVLSWGKGALVLEPPELRKEIEKEIKAMAAKYTGMS